MARERLKRNLPQYVHVKRLKSLADPLWLHASLFFIEKYLRPISWLWHNSSNKQSNSIETFNVWRKFASRNFLDCVNPVPLDRKMSSSIDYLSIISQEAKLITGTIGVWWLMMSSLIGWPDDQWASMLELDWKPMVVKLLSPFAMEICDYYWFISSGTSKPQLL